MCLSTVMKVNGPKPSVLCNNIQNVTIDPNDGKLTFTDIMGARFEAYGTIRQIDLVEKKILFEEKS